MRSNSEPGDDKFQPTLVDQRLACTTSELRYDNGHVVFRQTIDLAAEILPQWKLLLGRPPLDSERPCAVTGDIYSLLAYLLLLLVSHLNYSTACGRRTALTSAFVGYSGILAECGKI
jgi:hypothetical protein